MLFSKRHAFKALICNAKYIMVRVSQNAISLKTRFDTKRWIKKIWTNVSHNLPFKHLMKLKIMVEFNA